MVFCTSRPRWVRASAPTGCSPRGPGGVDLFLQGLFLTLSEGFYRIRRAHECEFGSLGLGKIAGRAPEPLHGARGRSGVPLAFCATLAHPFCSEGGVVCRALACEPRSLGLGKVAGRAPEPLHRARGRSGVPLGFVRPSRILFVQKEGLFAKPSRASLGRWVSARSQEEPPSLYTEREGDHEFP